MNLIAKRRDSGITVTDQFCGAGGSTIGAKRAGLIVLEAQNHWKRAIETYASNHQNTRVHLADVSNTDPRKLVSTDILITSPECTTHSPAGGNQPRPQQQRDIFMPDIDDPKFERSRATMRDVPRYAEYHHYPAIILENVVEATRWPLFHHWLKEMELLDYKWRIVSFNSMFAHPTPQSRDRIYIVFWKKGNRTPNLDIHPIAPCAKCGGDVESVQTWKRQALERAINNNPVGKYRSQYTYTCPRCMSEVLPYYYAAMNAIDFTQPGQRIGDRKVPLKPRTMERIRYGLDKFGKRVLVVQTNMTTRLATRVKSADDPLGTLPTSSIRAVLTPFLVRMRGAADGGAAASAMTDATPSLVANGASCGLVSPEAIAMLLNTSYGGRQKPIDALRTAMPTQTTIQDKGMAMTPAAQEAAMLIETRHGGAHVGSRAADARTDPLTSQTTKVGQALVTSPGFVTPAGSNDGNPRELASEALQTQTGTDRLALALGPAFVAVLRSHNKPQGLEEQLATICTGGGHHLLVAGSALMSMRDSAAMHVGDLSEEMRALTTAQQTALLGQGPQPFVANYHSDPSGIDEPLRTHTTIEGAGVVDGAPLAVEDCYFRMLMAHEIGAGMAFPSDYIVTGNSGEQIKQYGNAVTPPVMDILSQRVAASLAPEIE
jgi:DNA (cytosine-5)-methyltransferase 1